MDMNICKNVYRIYIGSSADRLRVRVLDPPVYMKALWDGSCVRLANKVPSDFNYTVSNGANKSPKG